MRWIDCRQSQPETNQRVLVFAKDISENSKPYFANGFLSIGDYKGNGNYVLKEPCYPFDVEVLKWMRIPPFPQQSIWSRFRCWLASLLMPAGPCVIDEGEFQSSLVQPDTKKGKGLPVLLN